MRTTKKVLISGLVQGVFFRAFIKDKANELKIKGHVRNLDDGKVEAVIEGSVKDIEKMVEICRRGAPHSRVNEIEVEDIKNQGFKDFKILNF